MADVNIEKKLTTKLKVLRYNLEKEVVFYLNRGGDCLCIFNF